MRIVFAIALLAAAPECMASPTDAHLFNGQPASNPAGWLTARDASGQKFTPRGRVGFTLTVGPDGSAQACAVHDSSGDSRTDELTCAVMNARARFHPAHDRAGVPVATRYSSSVSWTRDDRPKVGPPALAIDAQVAALPDGIPSPARLTLEILVDETGKVRDCDGGGDVPTPLETQGCKILMDGRRIEPLVDGGGKPQTAILGATLQLHLDH